jgi:hypothetical protein
MRHESPPDARGRFGPRSEPPRPATAGARTRGWCAAGPPGVAHGLSDPGLAPEAAPERLVSREILLDDLQCNRGPVSGGGPVHTGHPADADQGVDPAFPESSPDAVISRERFRLVTHCPRRPAYSRARRRCHTTGCLTRLTRTPTKICTRAGWESPVWWRGASAISRLAAAQPRVSGKSSSPSARAAA